MKATIITPLTVLLLTISSTVSAQQPVNKSVHKVTIVNHEGKSQPDIYAYYEVNDNEKRYFKSDSNGVMAIIATDKHIKMRINAKMSKGYRYNSFSLLKDTVVYNTRKDYETALNEKVYDIGDCDEFPEFPGGVEEYWNFIRKKIDAERAKLPGTSHFPFGSVIIQCVIDKEGDITLPQIIKSMDSYTDKLALEIIQSMPKWKPARIGNNSVSCLYIPLPIPFSP